MDIMLGISLLLFTLLQFGDCLSNQDAKTPEEEPQRTKRQLLGLPLVFPFGGLYKFIIGFASPVHNIDYANFALAANFQYQYMHVQNITEISQYYAYKTVTREQRDADLESRRDERLTFYKAVEEMLTVKGFNGPECIRRAICEVAQFPVKEEALIGELIQILLTPNYGRDPFETIDKDFEAAMFDYLSAYTAGEQMFDCVAIYTGCPEGEGMLEMISELKED